MPLTASTASLAVLTAGDAAGSPAEFVPLQAEDLTELTDEAGGQLA